MQPLPVPTSAARIGPLRSRAIATARCTRTSVSGLGTITAGVTMKSRAMNSLCPTRYATGSPRERPATSPRYRTSSSSDIRRSNRTYRSMRPTPRACASRTSASRRGEVEPCFCRCPVARVSTSSTVSSGEALDAVAAVELRRALGRDQRRHELVQVTGHYLVELVQRELDAVIGDAVLMDVYGTTLIITFIDNLL